MGRRRLKISPHAPPLATLQSWTSANKVPSEQQTHPVRVFRSAVYAQRKTISEPNRTINHNNKVGDFFCLFPADDDCPIRPPACSVCSSRYVRIILIRFLRASSVRTGVIKFFRFFHLSPTP